MSPEELRNAVTTEVLQHNYDDGPLLLLAGPGTGKTYSLIKTIQTKANESLQPNDFFEATLTNAAVEKFLEDIEEEIPEFENSSTLHFRAKGILHKYADRVGLQHDFTVFGENELRVLLADASLFFVDSPNIEEELINYQCLVAQGENPSSHFRWVYSRLQLFYNAVDWYRVVGLASTLLKEHEDIRRSECSRFKFLLVDEYQDLNGADQELVQLLLNGRSQLLAVGDDDQSIYSGRYADPRGIIAFPKLHPEAKKIVLPVCSRCPSAVLKCSHRLISRNIQREAKPELVPLPRTEERSAAGFVFSVNLKSEKAETEFVGSAISVLMDTAITPDEILVLCLNKEMGKDLFEGIATNHPELPLEDAMDKKESNPQELLLQYLSLFLDNPERNLALRMILERVFQNSGLEISQLVKYATTKRVSLWRALSQSDGMTQMKAHKEALPEFFAVASEAMEHETLEEKVCFMCDHYAGLERLKPFLQRQADQTSAEANKDTIRFMSMHSSKGLETDFVFIPFMEDHFRLPAQDLEEARRLLYVAITRARVGVLFSWAWSRRSSSRFKAGGGPNTNRQPSCFISECGLNPSMFGWPSDTPAPHQKALELVRDYARHVAAWEKAASV